MQDVVVTAAAIELNVVRSLQSCSWRNETVLTTQDYPEIPMTPRIGLGELEEGAPVRVLCSGAARTRYVPYLSFGTRDDDQAAAFFVDFLVSRRQRDTMVGVDVIFQKAPDLRKP